MILVGLVALVAAWYFSHDAKVGRELRSAQRRPIAALPEGTRGKIVGAARRHGGELLEGPLTGRPCVYYRVRVEEATSGRNSTTWRTLIKEERGVPFVVADDSGRAIVDPMDARVSLEVDSRTQSGTFDDPTDNESRFLALHGKSGQGLMFNRKLRYTEAVIEENEVVAVLGQGVREPDPDAAPQAAYRGEQPTLLRMSGNGEHALVISDKTDTTSS